MFNVRLAGGHLYGKQLFTWLSLAVSLMASFVLSFFPLDVLDEIWDLIESVSEGFLTYSYYVYIEEQTGFVSAMETVDNVLILQGLITHLLSQRKTLLYAFVDLKRHLPSLTEA